MKETPMTDNTTRRGRLGPLDGRREQLFKLADEGRTIGQIADLLGISGQRVSQVLQERARMGRCRMMECSGDAIEGSHYCSNHQVLNQRIEEALEINRRRHQRLAEGASK